MMASGFLKMALCLAVAGSFAAVAAGFTVGKNFDQADMPRPVIGELDTRTFVFPDMRPIVTTDNAKEHVQRYRAAPETGALLALLHLLAEADRFR